VWVIAGSITLSKGVEQLAKETTFYLIAYDIPVDKRRTKVHKILSGFGHWTQYSLFECHLTDKQYVQLRQRLEVHIQEQSDSVRFYALCSTCMRKVETIGGHKPNDPDLFLV
jgi:CRISPR-associated protein Cas2